MTSFNFHSVSTPGGSFLRARSDVVFAPAITDITIERFDRLEVAPIGSSGLRCRNGHFFGLAVVWRGPAPYCGEGACRERGEQHLVAVVHSDASLIEEPETVHSRSWWHTTDAKNEFKDDSDVIHSGTKRAALFRAQAVSEVGQPIKLWELQTREDAAIASDVVMDNSNVDAMSELAISLVGHGIVRYVNGREDAGSVSLLARSSAFVLKGETIIPVPSRV